jgi:hypothetical protein
VANIVRCFSPVPGYKGNGCRGYKGILALLKLRGLVKEYRQKDMGKRIREEGAV